MMTQRMKKFLAWFGGISLVVLLLGLAGGTTDLVGLIYVEDAAGSRPTCATSTVAGELCVEGDLEANGNLDIAGTSTLTGATTLSGDVTVTGYLNGAELHTDRVTLSNSDIVNLRATNKTLVAAQGANTLIVPVSVVFFLDYGSAQCTESADNLELHYNGAGGSIACTAFETTGSWLVNAADAYGYYTCDSYLVIATASNVNLPLTLDNNGDGEFGGCTGSTAIAWVTYYVISAV